MRRTLGAALAAALISTQAHGTEVETNGPTCETPHVKEYMETHGFRCANRPYGFTFWKDTGDGPQ